MRSQKVIGQRLGEVDGQIRDIAETATKVEWDKLHNVDETLRWILNVPTETKE